MARRGARQVVPLSLARYVVVGAVSTAVHYAALVGAVEWLHWPAWWASGAGAVLGAQVAFLGNRQFTFAHQGKLRASWPRFQATAGVGSLLGMVIVAAVVRVGGHYLLGQVLATLSAMGLTYVINRRWTFAHPPGSTHPPN